MQEIEIRTVIHDGDEKQKVVDRLLKAGFSLKRKVVQQDVMFDREDASLFKSGCKIRYRIEGDQRELTYKGSLLESASVSRRVELNVGITGGTTEEVTDFFTSLGYPLCFQVKKERAFYARGGISVTFDEWPIIGCMIEIEGDEEVIKTVAKEIAPDHPFGNKRLKDYFQETIASTGKTLAELKDAYFQETGFDLGRIELIM